MISARDLTDDQIAAVREWADHGSQLAEIQKRLQGQFGLSVTYMDTRFLILDLGIELQPEKEEEPEPEAEGDEGPEAESVSDPEPAALPGQVTVTTDELVRPGAMVSGTVTFSDGEKARWWLDQMGPGLDPDTAGYQPSREDLMAFEKELRRILGA